MRLVPFSPGKCDLSPQKQIFHIITCLFAQHIYLCFMVKKWLCGSIFILYMTCGDATFKWKNTLDFIEYFCQLGFKSKRKLYVFIMQKLNLQLGKVPELWALLSPHFPLPQKNKIFVFLNKRKSISKRYFI